MRHAHLGLPARKVLALLRRSADTVDGLARSLGLTENAVRTQLEKLERLGLVVRKSRRASASKPAIVFGISPEGQTAFSAAYAPVLRHLMQAAVATLPKRRVDSLMEQCGSRIAADFGTPPLRVSERISGAADILNGLGGDAAVKRKGSSFVIESTGCPLSAVTAEIPAGCRIVEAIIKRYVREQVEICCHIGADPRCCFLITPAKSRAARLTV